MIGVSLLGVAAGAIGAFALLRKRAMMSDVLSHATLPGIGVAFLVAVALGANGRSLPVLLTGATTAAIVAALTVQWLSRSARLPEDAAMGAVLSVFFGLGAVLLSFIQTLRTGAEGGLSHFILGQTAAMSAQDAVLIGVVAAAAGWWPLSAAPQAVAIPAAATSAPMSPAQAPPAPGPSAPASSTARAVTPPAAPAARLTSALPQTGGGVLQPLRPAPTSGSPAATGLPGRDPGDLSLTTAPAAELSAPRWRQDARPPAPTR
jgi:hypothetical protein